MRCEAPDCTKEATTHYGCEFLPCPESVAIYVCDEHRLTAPSCHFCGEPLVADTVEEIQRLRNAIDPTGELYDDIDEDDELPITDQAQLSSCSTGKVIYDSKLAVGLDVCGGDITTLLGHSFAGLRTLERSLRKWAGISTSGETVSGPNIALGEIRMLLTNADCEVFEFAFRLVDQRERTFVFRSTGGTVLVPKAELLRLQAGVISATEGLVLTELQTCSGDELPLVRCFAESAQSEFTTSQLYAMAGAYSFFQPEEGKAAHEVNLAASAYKLGHDGAYRLLMEAPDSNELFHHSEQALFRALYEHPELLEDAIDLALMMELLPDEPLRLEAVALDVFTTRQACRNCMKGAAKVLDHDAHFFSRALAVLAEKLPQIDLRKVRRFVRFDCDFRFDEPTKPALSKVSCILHGLPGKPIACEPKPFEVLFLSLPANVHENSLLDSGAALTYSPAILPLLLELNKIVDLPPATPKLAQLVAKFLGGKTLHENVFITAWFVNKYCAKHVRSTVVEDIMLSADPRGKELTTPAQQQLTARMYFMHAVLTELRFKKEAVLVMCCCAATLLGADILDDVVFKAVCVAHAKHTREVLAGGNQELLFAEVGRQMKVRIDQLLKESKDGNAAAENAARTIAVQYALLDYYLSKISAD